MINEAIVSPATTTRARRRGPDCRAGLAWAGGCHVALRLATAPAITHFLRGNEVAVPSTSRRKAPGFEEPHRTADAEDEDAHAQRDLNPREQEPNPLGPKGFPSDDPCRAENDEQGC